MQKNNSNQALPYSKINTVLLVLLLILAVGVFYVTYRQNHDEEIIPTSVEDMFDGNNSNTEISVDVLSE